ncbi:alpha-1,2-fucosyltransferase [Sphaerochaeta sp.]|uniref:alpha-1,2-fucosyltransferase n=1 Tax=Sphaerochaeta sp. TaxID=1972642 RepID=UPI002FCC256F
MIVVKIWGGFGNQLFQYAFGYALAKRNGQQLLLDLSFYTERANREPLIRLCNLEFSEEKKDQQYNKNIHRYQHSSLYRFYSKLCSILGLGTFLFVPEKEPRYLSHLKSITPKPYTFLEGYWQTSLYFDEFRQSLKKQFVPKVTSNAIGLLGEQIRSEPSIALHVRRGDYLKFTKSPSENDSLYLLDASYFHDAITQMLLLIPNGIIYCFSDDIPWCKQEFKMYPIIYMDPDPQRNDVEEWFLMSQCQHHIVSNSSFSWWAAYVNNNPQKIILRPSRWFGNHDIYPSEWIEIPLRG